MCLIFVIISVIQTIFLNWMDMEIYIVIHFCYGSPKKAKTELLLSFAIQHLFKCKDFTLESVFLIIFFLLFRSISFPKSATALTVIQFILCINMRWIFINILNILNSCQCSKCKFWNRTLLDINCGTIKFVDLKQPTSTCYGDFHFKCSYPYQNSS